MESLTRAPQSGDRVSGGAGPYELVHVGVGAIVLRELGPDLRPTGRPVSPVTPEGWLAMKEREKDATRCGR